MLTPDHKMYELNRRIHNRPLECDVLWWDSFVSEFFEDNATLTVHVPLDDGLKRFSEFTSNFVLNK